MIHIVNNLCTISEGYIVNINLPNEVITLARVIEKDGDVMLSTIHVSVNNIRKLRVGSTHLYPCNEQLRMAIQTAYTWEKMTKPGNKEYAEEVNSLFQKIDSQHNIWVEIMLNNKSGDKCEKVLDLYPKEEK